MGTTDSIPVISQTKSLVQVICGDVDGARQTQINFTDECIGVSQIKTTCQLIGGDIDSAKKTNDKFLNGCNNVVDSIPIVGHIKGSIHYACNDFDGGDNAMRSSSRTTGVIVGAVTGTLIGGPVGGVTGAITGGNVTDSIITGIESGINKEYTPSGNIAAVTNIINGETDSGQVFDFVYGVTADGMAGKGVSKSLRKVGKKTSKVIGKKMTRKIQKRLDKVQPKKKSFYHVTDKTRCDKAVKENKLQKSYQAENAHNSYLKKLDEHNKKLNSYENNPKIPKIKKQKLIKDLKDNIVKDVYGETWISEDPINHSKTFMKDDPKYRTHTVKIKMDEKYHKNFRNNTIPQDNSSSVNLDRVNNGKCVKNLWNNERLGHTDKINIGIKNENLDNFNKIPHKNSKINVNSFKYKNKYTKAIYGNKSIAAIPFAAIKNKNKPVRRNDE